MIDKIKKAISAQIPVDIYFRIAIDNQPERCILYYPCFLITSINIENLTFEGYTIQERHKNSNDKLITTDSIGFICNLYNPML
jgi:hypothetical protein